MAAVADRPVRRTPPPPPPKPEPRPTQVNTPQRTEPAAAKPERAPTPPAAVQPKPVPEANPIVTKSTGSARLEKQLDALRLQTQLNSALPSAAAYDAAVNQQKANDAALTRSLGADETKLIDQRVQQNTRDLGSSPARDRAVRDTKAQLDAAQTDPERARILEQTVRTALPLDGAHPQLRERQQFVQSLAQEVNQDPKLRDLAQRTLLEEADLRTQKPGVAALMETPPRPTADANAAADLQNAQVLATSAFSRSEPDQQRELIASSSPERAARLGRLLTTPVEVPSTNPIDGTTSERRRALTTTLTSLGGGAPNDATRAFTRAVATNLRSGDVPSADDRAYGNDNGLIVDRLAKAWGHQSAPDDPRKAALNEVVVRRGLDPEGEGGQRLRALTGDARRVEIAGLLDDPASFAFAHPDAVGLRNDRELRRAFADEATSRWTEQTPGERQAASTQLQALLGTRQGQDLLLSPQIPAAERAQYLDRFRRDPGARTDPNAALLRDNLDVYRASGRTDFNTYRGKSLENALGTSLGLPPDAAAARDPRALDEALRSEGRSFYTTGASGDVVDHLAARIRETAGKDAPDVRIIPIQFASATSGSRTTQVYGVKDPSGREHFIDHQGRRFDSFDSWRRDNQLPSGTFSYPDGFDTKGGRVVTADTPQTGKQEAWAAADVAVLGLGAASQLVQKIPHPVAVAAGTVGTIATLGYGGVRGAQGLHDTLVQGRSLDPIKNPSTIPDYLNLATAGLPAVAQSAKYLAGVPSIARNPALTTALRNTSTAARVLDAAADTGQVGTALAYAAQNPNDPAAVLNAALSTAFFAPRAFRSGSELVGQLRAAKSAPIPDAPPPQKLLPPWRRPDVPSGATPQQAAEIYGRALPAEVEPLFVREWSTRSNARPEELADAFDRAKMVFGTREAPLFRRGRPGETEIAVNDMPARIAGDGQPGFFAPRQAPRPLAPAGALDSPQAVERFVQDYFNPTRAAEVRANGRTSSEGRPLTYFRTIGPEELRLLAERGELPSSARSPYPGRAPATGEQIARYVGLDYAHKGDRAFADELAQLSPEARSTAILERARQDPRVRDRLFDSHNDMTDPTMDPLKSVSLGPHYAPQNGDYVVVIHDVEGRAVRNRIGDYEGEWLFSEGIRPNEIAEVLSADEFRRRYPDARAFQTAHGVGGQLP